MEIILQLLTFALFLGLIIGMIKPAIVLPKFIAHSSLPSFLLSHLKTATDTPTRGQVLKIYLTLIFLDLILIGMLLSPKHSNSNTQLNQATSDTQASAANKANSPLEGNWDCTSFMNSTLISNSSKVKKNEDAMFRTRERRSYINNQMQESYSDGSGQTTHSYRVDSQDGDTFLIVYDGESTNKVITVSLTSNDRFTEFASNMKLVDGYAGTYTECQRS